MLYLVRNLEQAYDKLKDILKNDKLRIYMFSTNSGKIKVDIEKTIEDLKYISTFYSFYLLEFNSELIKELKSLKELSLKDWQDIFYNFNAENEYSIYSKRLEKKDYEKVISQMRENYLKYNKENCDVNIQSILKKREYSDFLILVKEFYDECILILCLETLYDIYGEERKTDFKEIGFNGEGSLYSEISDFLEKISSGIKTDLDKEKILCFVKKEICKLPIKIEKPIKKDFWSLLNNGLKGKLESKIKAFILFALKKEYILSFISLFYFNIKPLDEITLKDIDELVENLCEVKEYDLKNYFKRIYRDCNKEFQKEEYENDFMKYFFEEKNIFPMQKLLENLSFKFNILKRCAIEKIVRYLNLNNFIEEECEKKIKEKLDKTCLRDLYKKIKPKNFKNNIWHSYLKYLEKSLFEEVEGNECFYFNDFFRMELFYRREMYKILLEIEREIENNPEVTYEEAIGNQKGLFEKIKLSERNIGDKNYERIISYYDKKIFSIRDEDEKEKIEEKKVDFMLKQVLLEKYKDIFDIKMSFDKIKDKNMFYKYENYIELTDIHEVKIDRNGYMKNVNILGESISTFFYQKEKLEKDKIRVGDYYVVKMNDKSKDILLLQFLGELESKLLFRSRVGIESYFFEEIDVRKIKFLEFLEEEKKSKGISVL